VTKPEIFVKFDVESGTFVSNIPALGVLSAGETEEEARAAALDAASQALAFLRDQEHPPQSPPKRWWVGRKIPVNIYKDGEIAGQCQSAELAAEIVEGMCKLAGEA
jgi:predicted RNase H-like HicB family nuclease